MKARCSKKGCRAMTLVDVLVVIAVLAVLVALFLPMLARTKGGPGPRNCPSNLKQIGLAYRMWANDNNGKYPMQVAVTNGGTLELATGINAWINFQAMSNELSTPKILICPTDTKHFVATKFGAGFDNHNVSYFVGLEADQSDPQTVLSGDSNFEISGTPVKSGLLLVSSNTPIAWSAARHKFRGNIVLADGSVQSISSSNLPSYLRQSSLATNRFTIP
jgi:prepilin-type processing-associated H-X9-DG protein